MCAVYAFARRIDDIGDDGDDRDAQLQALREQRAMVARLDLDDDMLDDPVRIALAHARRHYALPVDALELLIEGVELDVIGAEYESFDQLVAYCRRVAGTIGRLCVAIFTDGHASDADARLADDLGVAMQLTNILRDVREDALLGRTYLPAEDLRRFGCEDLADVAASTGHGAGSLNGSAAGAIELIRFEADRAAAWFQRGMCLTESLDRRSASCLQAMTGIYRTILERIVQDPVQVLRHRVSLSGWEKGVVAARSLVGAGAAPVARPAT
jgi:phytoene synthase